MREQKEQKNYTLPLWTIIVVCITVLICIATCNGCKKGGETQVPKTDTVYLPGEKTIERVPVLSLENGRIPDPTKVVIDSFVAYEKILMPVDSNEIIRPWIEKYNEVAEANNKLLQEFNTIREYIDSARFKAGLVTVKNKAQKNRIFDQQIFLDSALFVNNTIAAKQRNKFSLALGSQWQSDTTLGFLAGFTVNTKKGWGYSLKGMIDTRQRKGIQGEILLPLSLRRKK